MERWRFDLRSRVLLSPSDGPNHFLDDIHLSSYHHEICHWIHTQSTSIGLLVALIERAMALTARNALSELPLPERQTILSEAMNGSPIWSYAAGYDPSRAGPKFGLSGQFWLDLKYFYDLVIRPRRIEGMAWHGMESLKCALADAWLAAASFEGLSKRPPNEIAEKWLTGDWDRVFVAGELTPQVLWECYSVLDELSRTMLSRDHPRDSPTADRLASVKLASSRYGVPWKLMHSAWGGRHVPLDAVRAAIHFSLDPPMPFLGNSETPTPWHEIDPAQRFMALCETLGSSRVHRTAVVEAVAEPWALMRLFAQFTGLTTATWPVLQSTPPSDDPGGEGRACFQATGPSLHQPYAGDLNLVIQASLQLRSQLRDRPDLFIYPDQTRTSVIEDSDTEAGINRMFFEQSLLRPFVQGHADGSYVNYASLGRRHRAALPFVNAGEYLFRCLQRNILLRLVNGGEWSVMDYLPNVTMPADILKDIIDQLNSDDRYLIW
jgi:hypothetical protein